MKAILILLLSLSSFALAEKTFASKPIAMDEVVSAITWIKLPVDLPTVRISESSDQITFKVLDDVYTMTRDGDRFKLVRTAHYRWSNQTYDENVILDSMAIEKILVFVKAKKREAAVLPTDIFNSSIRNKTPPTGFQNSLSFFQCSSDLPAKILPNGTALPILQHTWMQNGAGESFGMPSTDDSSYFGGRAHIRTPDSFIGRGPQHLNCSPAWIPVGQDESLFSKKLACVARSLSLEQNPVFDDSRVTQNWIAHFDYHALDRNCLMATRFVLSCAGALAPQVVNAGIGGKYEWNDLYSVSEIHGDLHLAILNLRNQLNQYRRQKSILDLANMTETLMNQAIDLDSKLRGVSGNDTPKTLQEICQLALDQCP